ncbi:hypothetical protein SCLCIDRAFT_247448 [Scleroderma citrinum Foug A]|uniref:Uncharacterized protein n=1 Tax=Scleroderma citrinum Foug A TaxID=1036808 RepID=A0A0C2Z305_9AGAM|nr:hypothetical protein SCLCIDRAFT_247448 [Scleroderma citrinum Foug A]
MSAPAGTSPSVRYSCQMFNTLHSNLASTLNFTEHYVLSSKCYIVDEDLDTKLLDGTHESIQTTKCTKTIRVQARWCPALRFVLKCTVIEI